VDAEKQYTERKIVTSSKAYAAEVEETGYKKGQEVSHVEHTINGLSRHKVGWSENAGNAVGIGTIKSDDCENSICLNEA